MCRRDIPENGATVHTPSNSPFTSAQSHGSQCSPTVFITPKREPHTHWAVGPSQTLHGSGTRLCGPPRLVSSLCFQGSPAWRHICVSASFYSPLYGLVTFRFSTHQLMDTWDIPTCALLLTVINRIMYYEHLCTSSHGRVFPSLGDIAKTYDNSTFNLKPICFQSFMFLRA